ncbi:MAG: sensor histidine kinase [Cyanobacteriota bacterium]
MAWFRSDPFPTGRPVKGLKRQQRDLFLLYLGSLTAVLAVMALIVRAGFVAGELADTRSQLLLIGDDLSTFPPPRAGFERTLQETRKDFATAHQQVEWFLSGRGPAIARLGELRSLGPLPRPTGGQTLIWQRGPDWIALVRPLDAAGQDSRGVPRVWLRISQGLEPVDQRLQQLDLALTVAILVALALSAATSLLLTRRAAKPLQRSLARLRQFSLDASHELRGPLAALAANADMGLLDPGTLPPLQRRRFEVIASAAQQMEQLVNDLLLLARHDEQRLELPQRLNLTLLLEQQLRLHRDGIALRQQSLSVELEPALMVQGQPSLLQRLFRNLLDNAQRYTPEGGTIAVQAQSRGQQVLVSVTDQGRLKVISCRAHGHASKSEHSPDVVAQLLLACVH